MARKIVCSPSAGRIIFQKKFFRLYQLFSAEREMWNEMLAICVFYVYFVLHIIRDYTNKYSIYN